MTKPESDLELFEVLDWEPEITCEYEHCSSQAVWTITWQCGCNYVYCDYHRRLVVSRALMKQIKCKKHGVPSGNEPTSIEPIGKS